MSKELPYKCEIVLKYECEARNYKEAKHNVIEAILTDANKIRSGHASITSVWDIKIIRQEKKQKLKK